MVTNTRLSLRLNKQVIADLKQKALAEGKSISEFIIDSKNFFDFELTGGIALRVDYIKPIFAGSEVYRIDIFFKETASERILRPLWYELWVLQDIVEDKLWTPGSPNDKDFAEYAFRFIAERFKESNNMLPDEYGAFVWTRRGIKLAKNRTDLWGWYDEAILEKRKK